jgi:hypothetical protein
MKGLAFVAGAAFAMAGCAPAPVAPGTPKVVSRVAIAPYAAHFECIDLQAGDRLEYRFETSEPVAFNIHYRDGGITVMPITRDNVIEDAGGYSPPAAKPYCLAWEAGNAGAILGYRVSLRRGAP